MKKILIVYETTTNKIVPFRLVPPYGEVQIVSSGLYNYDNLHINMIDVANIDFDNMRLITTGDMHGKETYQDV